MFDNVGYKLKVVAKIVCWIGIIAAVVSGIALIVQRMALVGIVTIIGGALIAWLSALGLYGFGELVENSDIRTNIAAKQDMEREAEKKNA